MADNNRETNVRGTQPQTVRLAKMAMLAAISIVLMILIRIPFPLLPILEYDPADISIMIGAFAFGPAAGIVITVIVSLIQCIAFASTGWYGGLMHIIATGTFVLVAANIYKIKKSKKGALIALATGIIVAVIVMMPANYFITSSYFQMPREALIPMLPAIALFNFLKFGINSVVTFLLYKRISGFLHR